MDFFRIHIRPKGGSASDEMSFEYCRKNQLLGVGWQTDSRRNTKDWDEYCKEASEKHDDLNICRYIKENVREGDLVWTRDSGGEYYLARVTSGWEYFQTDEARNKDIDIANIFRVDLKKAEVDLVPGKVVACFRAPRTIQRIADTRALEYSKYLWNEYSNSDTYEIDKSEFPDIFTMLDDEETEDLVFMYLQSQGWYMVPNSRKGDTMGFEYLAVNPKTREKALTQVKTGDSEINKDDYREKMGKIFLFQSNEYYSGENHKNIECIPRETLQKFMHDSIDWLPAVFKRKMELVG